MFNSPKDIVHAGLGVLAGYDKKLAPIITSLFVFHQITDRATEPLPTTLDDIVEFSTGFIIGRVGAK